MHNVAPYFNRFTEAGLPWSQPSDVRYCKYPKDCILLQENSSYSYEFKQSIVLKNISFKYNSESSYVLKDVHLSITPGECIGFIGTTGCGKSTLVDIIMGFLKPTSGQILVDGVDIHNQS